MNTEKKNPGRKVKYLKFKSYLDIPFKSMKKNSTIMLGRDTTPTAVNSIKTRISKITSTYKMKKFEVIVSKTQTRLKRVK
jgi:hypothetical protein